VSSARLELVPIGVIRSPWKDRYGTPRQPSEARDIAGTIELDARPELEHALADLQLWSHIWVIFWFHLNQGWRPKVQPPRSQVKRGVFATRAPYRPNPLGLSVLRLDAVEGRVLRVRDLDILDGTPVLDIKPYVAYSDAVAAASGGWLNEPERIDPGPRYAVSYSDRAEEQLGWLSARTGLDLRGLAEPVLSAGPAPHPYRRIRARRDHFELGVKDFRLRFRVEELSSAVNVFEVASGYRESVLRDPRAQPTERTPLAVHREFVELFAARVC
jgi:tRNA (adenine37-N6)-methyltransferase